MSPQGWGAWGATFAGLGVVTGAIGAHALKGTFATLGTAEIWDTASTYQLAHGIALVLTALAAFLASHLRGVDAASVTVMKGPLVWASRLFLGGIILFSGSLYLYAVGAGKFWAHVTPFGGFAFILGWFVFAYALLRLRRAA